MGFKICPECKGIVDATNSQCTCENKKNIEHSSLIEEGDIETMDQLDDIRTYDNFSKDVEKSINSNCIENNSNTPDFILADYLRNQLKLVEKIINWRDAWYSINPYPCPGYSEVYTRIGNSNLSYCGDCKYLSLTEREQNMFNLKKISHRCTLFNSIVLHKDKHPEIQRLDICNDKILTQIEEIINNIGDAKNDSKHNE